MARLGICHLLAGAITVCCLSVAAQPIDEVWFPLGGSTAGVVSEAVCVGYPSLVQAVSGEIHLAWASSLAVHYLKWDGDSWDPLGSSSECRVGVSDGRPAGGSPSRVEVALDAAGNPIVAWWLSDAGGLEDGRILVARWDGATWAEMGSGSKVMGLESEEGPITGFDMAVDSQGNPVITWGGFTPSGSRVFVLRWNGGAWTEVGSDSATGEGISQTSGAQWPSIALDAMDCPVVAWQDSAVPGGDIYVRRWTGSAWSEVGAGSASGEGISGALFDYRPSLAIDASGNPLVAWYGSQFPDPFQIFVRRWSGIAWEEVGAGSATGEGISGTLEDSTDPVIAAGPSSEITLAWRSDDHLLVRQWDGLGWKELGEGSGIAPGLAGVGQEVFGIALASTTEGDMAVTWLNVDLTVPFQTTSVRVLTTNPLTLPPVIEPIEDQTATHLQSLVINADLAAGIPEAWSLLDAPAGAMVNSGTGQVDWPVPSPVGSVNTFRLAAMNSAGSDEVTWNVTVLPLTAYPASIALESLGNRPNGLPAVHLYVSCEALPYLPDLDVTPDVSVSGAGDVDTDGTEDLLLGTWHHSHEEVAGPTSAHLVLGHAFEEFASDEVFVSSLSASEHTEFLYQADYTNLGRALSGVGDLNGDGAAEMLLGADAAEREGALWSGRAFFVPGSSLGVGTTGMLDLRLTSADANGDGSPDVTAIPASANFIQVGWDVTGIGDFNADGVDDFAVAVPNDGYPGNFPKPGVAKGRVAVVFGPIDDRNASGELCLTELDGSDGFMIDPYSSSVQTGFAVAGLGDVNGDGIDDMAVTSPGFASGASDLPGHGFVLYGHSGPHSPSLSLDALPPDRGTRLYHDDVGGTTGYALAGVGDFNGDGLNDILISAPFRENGGINPGGKGLAYLVLGKPDALALSGLLDLNALSPEEGAVFLNDIFQGQVGTALGGAGDVNGDGFSDILINDERAVQEPSSDHILHAECHLVLGRATPLGGSGERVDLSQSSDMRIYDDVGAPFIPRSLSTAGDVNRDGLSEMLVAFAYDYDWDNDHEDPLPPNPCRAVLIWGLGNFPAATYRTHAASGDPGPRMVGAIGDGTHSTPFSRCSVDHSAGSGPGHGDSSLETVTVTRSGASIEALKEAADVLWEWQTDRTGWETAALTFHHLPREVEGLDENDLMVYRADSPTGPWEVLATQRHSERDVLTATTTAPGFFALAPSIPPDSGMSLR